MGVEGIGGGKIVPIEWLRALDGAKKPGGSRDARPNDGAAPVAAASGVRSISPGESALDREASVTPPAAAASDDSRTREELIEEVKADLEALPDVRREKVIEARLRISRGYYDREDVRREILRSVLADLLPRPVPTPDGDESKEAAPGLPPGENGDRP